MWCGSYNTKWTPLPSGPLPKLVPSLHQSKYLILPVTPILLRRPPQTPRVSGFLDIPQEFPRTDDGRPGGPNPSRSLTPGPGPPRAPPVADYPVTDTVSPLASRLSSPRVPEEGEEQVTVVEAVAPPPLPPTPASPVSGPLSESPQSPGCPRTFPRETRDLYGTHLGARTRTDSTLVPWAGFPRHVCLGGDESSEGAEGS